MTGFALNLDLTLYFEDLRKYASIYVDNTKCKEVGDVENHIRTVFKLEDNICLTNKKFLIPRCESINILQQYETLKVQKCDFYDYQIHKNKNSNTSCDQSALNLIQSDRTIDLSCRPKQRFKINICQNRCILEAPLTPFDSQIGISPHLSVVPNESLLDGVSEIQTKCKTKNKKRKYDCHNGELEVNNDENLTSILDMSVKQSRKKNKNDFTVVNATPQITVGSPFNFLTQMEFNEENLSECKKKSKKRKKQLHIEEIDLSDSCWENFVASEGKPKKQKDKTNDSHGELNSSSAKDLSLSLNNSLKNGERGSNEIMFTDEECLVRKKRKSGKKFSDNHSTVDCDPNKSHSRCNKGNSTPIVETFNQEMNSLKDNITLISKDRIEHKRGFEEKDYSLNDYEKSCRNLDDDPSLQLSTPKVTNLHTVYVSNNDSSKINAEQFCTEVKSTKSIQDGTKSEFKRTRIRKHNKKKKREKRKLIQAVGPVVSRLNLQEIKSSPGSSDISKHIFFNDDDFNEEMKIPPTPPRFTVQGNEDNKSKTQPQENACLETPRASDDKIKTWQNDFLKAITLSSQPIIFQRSTPSPATAVQNDSLSQSSNISPTMLSNSISVNCHKDMNTSVCNNIDKETSGNINNMSKDLSNNVTREKTTLHNLEVDAEVNIKPRSMCTNLESDKPDLRNLVLTDYPIIDKLFFEDHILFKVLKLGENCEPKCSNIILAKVKNTTNFPEKICLQIMGGFEECDRLTRISEDQECFIVELRWSDIIEPRLFYP